MRWPRSSRLKHCAVCELRAIALYLKEEITRIRKIPFFGDVFLAPRNACLLNYQIIGTLSGRIFVKTNFEWLFFKSWCRTDLVLCKNGLRPRLYFVCDDHTVWGDQIDQL